MSMKNPLTPAGIEPATFRIVAQHGVLYILCHFMRFVEARSLDKRKLYFLDWRIWSGEKQNAPLRSATNQKEERAD